MKSHSYSPKDIERKWQLIWEDRETFRTPDDVSMEEKFYILPQFPYPSGSGLHVGHAEVYSACDIYARYQRMRGKKVLHAFGLDAFGLPAENYAIKTNVHPRVSTEEAGKNFCEQIRRLGISVDWHRFIQTIDPSYYRWTQWFFQLMYKRGLAYRKKQSVNWCESCKTVLANEQVVLGRCERSDDIVVQREMEQWYLKITDYADRLIHDLDRVDWPEETKMRQRNWIGRSEGIDITYEVKGTEKTITVFTTRPDTNFGATFVAMAPDGEATRELLEIFPEKEHVKIYIEKTRRRTELERIREETKTGVFTGLYAVNQLTGREMPIYVSDFVLGSVGTGALVGVPGHDERDFDFAVTFDLDIVRVVVGSDGDTSDITKKEQVQESAGTMINSGFLDGLDIHDAKEKMKDYLEEQGWGKRTVNYKLRDWSVSRQRFWGAPIPVVRSEAEREKKRQYVFIHGRNSGAQDVFWPWLAAELEGRGHTIVALDLEPQEPKADEQAAFLLDRVTFDENTVIVAHSHGGPVAFRILESLGHSVAKLVLVDAVLRPEFVDERRPDVEASTTWTFDFDRIKSGAREVVILADDRHPIISRDQTEDMHRIFDGRVVYVRTNGEHFKGVREPAILEESLVTGIKLCDPEDLPVLLPDDVDFKPTGESPLNYSDDFQRGVEEKYGVGFRREVDTLDTFMCSSWYFFRYLNSDNDTAFASPESLQTWMPVDYYLGGEEHVNGHLLYSRFFTKVLYDAGYIDFDEPFQKNRHQGLILGEDSRKMSKRWGNVINPTDVIERFGADTLRIYEMFMGPLEQTKPWSDSGVRGVRRFLDRVWRLFVNEDTGAMADSVVSREMTKEELSVLHRTIRKVGEDTEATKFNTAIAAMMELVNEMYKWDSVPREIIPTCSLLLAPYAPHIAEELWELAGNPESLAHEAWPSYDESYLVQDMITIVVQVNGKVRAKLDVSSTAGQSEVERMALTEDNVTKWLEGKAPKKVIYVPGKLVSVVV